MSDTAHTPTTASAYVECRRDVLKAYPRAVELARGLSYVAIVLRVRDGSRLQTNVLGSGSTADRAWADAYSKLESTP